MLIRESAASAEEDQSVYTDADIEIPQSEVQEHCNNIIRKYNNIDTRLLSLYHCKHPPSPSPPTPSSSGP